MALILLPSKSDEQQLLFSQLASDLVDMAVFLVNPVCETRKSSGFAGLGRACGVRGRRVFDVPGTATKNGRARVVVLNDPAQRVLDRVRDQHCEYVFTWEGAEGTRDRLRNVRNSGWIAACRRASARYGRNWDRIAQMASAVFGFMTCDTRSDDA